MEFSGNTHTHTHMLLSSVVQSRGSLGSGITGGMLAEIAAVLAHSGIRSQDDVTGEDQR